MAERANYYEQDDLKYLTRRSSANREFNTPFDETIDKSHQEDFGEESAHVVELSTRPTVSTHGLSKAEKCYLAIIGALVIGLTICNLVIQYKDNQLAEVTFEYQVKTSEVQSQTDLILNELAEKYDYNTIKQVANENGMILQNSQVRNVGE